MRTNKLEPFHFTSGRPLKLPSIKAPFVTVVPDSLWKKMPPELSEKAPHQRPSLYHICDLTVLKTVMPEKFCGEEVGQGGCTKNVENLLTADAPPPGAEFRTVTGYAPELSKSVASMVACKCVSLMKVVARLPPLNCTSEVRRKPVPVTVSVNCVLPTGSLVGAILETVGIGFVAVIVKLAVFETDPSGLATVTGNTPGVNRSVPDMGAVILPALK